MRPDSSSGWGDEFVSLRWRSILVQVLLAATILIDVIGAGLVFVEIGLVGDLIAARPVDLDALEANSEAATTLGTISLIALATTAVAWWLWQYRGHANLIAAGRRGLEHRPWGAVGWWLVPIANLWMPFKTMRELWKASEPVEDPGAWARVPTWPVLGWWWALWIVGNLLQSASGFATETQDLETIRTSDITAVAGLAVSVFAACLAIGVIRQITRRQVALASVLDVRQGVGSAFGSVRQSPDSAPAHLTPPALPPPPPVAPSDPN